MQERIPSSSLAPAERPNVIFLHVDQWRGDCLSIDGHPVVHTPYLDRLATEGIRFSHTYASCPTCVPSRASLMTGLAPEHHGRVGYKDGNPWNYPVTLAGEFTRHGYRTHAVGKLHAFPERNPLGFESVELHDGYLHFGRDRIRNSVFADDYLPWLREQTGRPDADHIEHGLNCNSVVARPWPMAEYLHPTNWVVTRGVDFLARHDLSHPFFLYLSFHRPHPPYDPPAWALDQYLHRDMPDVPVGNWAEIFSSNDRSGSPEAHRARYRPDILHRARAGYYGHMTHIDHQISRFLETLMEYRIYDRSWVIFTSDHGEMMGDHHLFRKGYAYEGSARVPFIIKPPRAIPASRGSVCHTVVEMRDFLPTLLDCAGLPSPHGLDGISFLAHVLGRRTEPLRPWLHGEHTIFDGSMQWLTDGCEKYIWHSGTGTEQLFDLASDPQELNDLALTPSAEISLRLAHWRRILASELREREEGFVDAHGHLLAGRPVSPVLRHPLSSSASSVQ